MIDRTWQVAPATLDAAATGAPELLEASLRDHGAGEDLVERIRATVHAPAVVLEVLRVGPGSMLRQRALLGGGSGVLAADGDDRDEVRPALVAETPAELVHVLLAGLGLRPRVGHLADVPPAVTLERVDQALLAVRDGGALPAQVQPTRPPEEHRWWGLRWHAPDRPADEARLQVLDVGRLWIQDDDTLMPADPVGIWLLLAPLLDALSRLGRQPVDARLLGVFQPSPADEAAGPETP